MRNHLSITTFFLSVSLAGIVSIGTAAAQDQRQREEFFETKIRPVLVKHCYECHSAESQDPQGGLLLDTREGIRRGGDTGHAVVPGELQDSLILDAMRHESFEMPPERRLPDEVIADFAKWIRQGAHDPRDGKSALIRNEIDFERAKEFWAFRPVTPSSLPTVADTTWPTQPADRFVLAKLESEGIAPNPTADPTTLVRRIHFDLIGLPPAPSEVDRFVKAASQDLDAAITELVDRLLESPQFGPRWGRHWLDVVRYAESTGMERNGTFTQAWRYRDYVIDAFQHDMPFDQFICEQIAGDLLPFESTADRDRRLVATGMLALGPKSLNEPKKEKFRMDVVDEQIDVVSRAFLGLTASCARCHDHKFDPIPQSEYYALAGIFTSTETLYGTSKTNGNRHPGRLLAISESGVKPQAVSGGANGAKEEKRYRNQLTTLQRKRANLQKQRMAAKNAAARKAIQKRLTQTDDDIRRVAGRLKRAAQPPQQDQPNVTLVMAVNEAAKIDNTRLRIRGEPDEYGKVIPRGFLTIASLESNPELTDQASGRDQLATWITRDSNPLTSRVIVNRVWQHLFGRGLVATVNNFGANGDRPTHPKLLDHLAAEFVRDGWSVKRLIRRLMLSKSYRLSSVDNQAALASDPDNHFYWRMNQRRLEAESIRDAMLLVSGQLELSPSKGSPVQKLGEGIIGRNLRSADLDKTFSHRSVYLPIVRGAVPEMLTLFDFPEPSIIGGARDVTTVPTQALFMMNSPAVLEASGQFANRVLSSSDDAKPRIRLAYQLALSREPTSEEMDRVLQFVGDTSLDDESLIWAGFCQSLFASSEFRYVN